MTKRTRQYLGILAAIITYYLVHEGAHFLCAILMGTFKSVHFMGIGCRTDACFAAWYLLLGRERIDASGRLYSVRTYSKDLYLFQ